jgi:dihydroxyacetone kinase
MPARPAGAGTQGDRVPDSGAAGEPRPGVTPGSAASARAAAYVLAALESATTAITANEAHLGAIDAVAGDGDHGTGMVDGIRGALQAARDAVQHGAGAGTTLRLAGERWSDQAGGTSGALWGSGLAAAGDVVGDSDEPQPAAVLAAVDAFEDSVVQRGGAAVGEKTMVDAIVPFREELAASLSRGLTVAEAWRSAAAAASAAAARTAEYAATRGRSRTHGDRSVGTPDPGAVSFALIVSSVPA